MIDALRILFCVAALFVCCGCDKVLFGEKTTYAPGFSESIFRTITPGMSVGDVTGKLGPPLRKRDVQWSEVWRYNPNNRPSVVTNGNTWTMYLDGSRLSFTPDGVVAKVTGDYLTGDFVGLNKAEVRAKVGAPTELKVTEAETIFFYSVADPSGGGTYKCRAVHFKTNKVSSLFSQTVYD